MTAVATACVEGAAHDWQKIGATSFSGDTWTHVADVLYCAGCRRYAAKRTAFLDHRRRKAADAAAAQADETAARSALIDGHRAAQPAAPGAEQIAEGS